MFVNFFIGGRFSISLKCEALKTDRVNTEELEPEPVRPVQVPEPPFRPVLVPIPGTRFFCPSLSESNDHYPYDELQLKLMRMNFAFHNDQLPQNFMTFFCSLFTDDSKVTQEDIDKFVEKVKERKKREQEAAEDDDDDEEEKPAGEKVVEDEDDEDDAEEKATKDDDEDQDND